MKMEFDNDVMFSAIEPSAGSGSYSEKPRLSPGRHLLTCARVLEGKKDGTEFTDRDGDRKLLVVFEADNHPDRAGILKDVYDPMTTITTDKESKVGRTKKFVGAFLHAAGVQQISALEDLVGMSAYAQVVHKGQWVNIDRWVTPDEIHADPVPFQSDQSASSNKDLNENAEESDQTAAYEEADVPF